MSVQIISLRSIALAAPLLVCGMSIGLPTNTAHANECLGRPKTAPPKGSHWYYRTDRKKGRKCWFLRALHQPVQHQAAHAPSTTTTPAPAAAAKTPTAAPTGTATGTLSSAPPAPPRKEAPPAPPPSQAGAPSATGPQAKAPTDNFIWPDPPPIATVATHKPDPVPSAVHAAVPTSKGTRAPHDQASHEVTGAVRNEAPTKPVAVTQTAAAPTVSYLKILLVVVLGLAAAGLLYKLTMKLAGMLGRRIIVDHSESKWVDRWPEQELRQHPQPLGPILERAAFNDDPPPSLVPAAGDHSAPRRRPADDGGHIRTRRTDAARPVPATVSERQDSLVQLIRDLDQLLQASKQA